MKRHEETLGTHVHVHVCVEEGKEVKSTRVPSLNNLYLLLHSVNVFR